MQARIPALKRPSIATLHDDIVRPSLPELSLDRLFLYNGLDKRLGRITLAQHSLD